MELKINRKLYGKQCVPVLHDEQYMHAFVGPHNQCDVVVCESHYSQYEPALCHEHDPVQLYAGK